MFEKDSPNWRYLHGLPMTDENKAELSEYYSSLPEVALKGELDEFQDKKRRIVTKFPELASGRYGPGHEQAFYLEHCDAHISLISTVLKQPRATWRGRGNSRKDFVIPILEQKGWSILDWAGESGLDFHTANDYLKGTTKPYRSTRVKLAKALGVDVEVLPR